VGHAGSAVYASKPAVYVCKVVENSATTLSCRFDPGSESDIEGIECSSCQLKGDSKILISLIARYLRFMRIQPLRKVTLRNTLGNTKSDQEMAEPGQVV
jgi:hypothetical protein